MRELNAKDFAIDKIKEIKQLCDDLKYTENKQLRVMGIERIDYLAQGIEEHLEYLDIIEEGAK